MLLLLFIIKKNKFDVTNYNEQFDKSDYLGGNGILPVSVILITSDATFSVDYILLKRN